MRTALPLFLVAVLVGGPGCIGSDYEGASTNPGKQEGATPEGAGDAPLPPEVVGSPKEDELTEEFGIFVARSSGADADGTRKKPFATIAVGLQRAKELGKRLYVCAETFEEAVTAERGIPMIGGLDCSAPTWKTKRDALTKIVAPSSPALRATNIDV
ncbi:MAG: hypothetical protein K0S65_4837, partial [Labilithrix sp.]|nr:hypothetical protein [Labilithrix sp.]